MDLVKITNTSDDRSVTLPGSNPVTIEPGQTRIVTWEVACAQLGNPVQLSLAERQWEYSLVRAWWGYMDGFDSNETWMLEKKPPLAVASLDDVPIFMLIDDPEGVKPAPGELMPDNLPGDSSDVLVLKAQIARQQEQMNKLEQLLTRLAQPSTVDLDPKDSNALATVDAGQSPTADTDASTGTTGQAVADALESGELPKPQPTDPNATDGPRVKVRR